LKKKNLYVIALLTALGVDFVQTSSARAQDAVAGIAQQEYKNFVEATGNEVIQVLIQKQTPLAKRKDEFRAILRTKFSIPSIGKFVLARYWRQADDGQKARYLKLFETAIVENYSAQFDNYANEKLQVVGAHNMEDGGVLVNSKVVRPSGAEPLLVDWKVFHHKKDNTFKIVDLVVNGVSMSITQRSEYAGLIQGAGGNMDTFLDNLSKKYPS
jgi:phospholipid transport system substrate-binding protein